MKYTNFDGFDVSKLGFGIMRMPVTDDSKYAYSKDMDIEESINMIRHAIDNGITYIDTAYIYHEGRSEDIVGMALKDGYRDKAVIATKIPMWVLEKEEDMYRVLDEQLKRMQVDCIDFYLLHSLEKKSFEKFKKFNYKKFFDYALKSGKIKYPSFSFHDVYSVFEDIINDYDWQMCQIQLNYTDDEYQAGIKGLQLAQSKNIYTVIMEPLKGGILAKNMPLVQDVYKEFGIEYDSVEGSFRYIVSNEKILTVLSGMSTMEQINQNIDIFSNIDYSPLTEKEVAMYKKAKEKLSEKIKVGCTGCSYCLPCPSNVAIPSIFRAYNNAIIFDEKDRHSDDYKRFMITNGQDSLKCIECGKCENECPQNLKIIESLKAAHTYLTSK